MSRNSSFHPRFSRDGHGMSTATSGAWLVSDFILRNYCADAIVYMVRRWERKKREEEGEVTLLGHAAVSPLRAVWETFSGGCCKVCLSDVRFLTQYGCAREAGAPAWVAGRAILAALRDPLIRRPPTSRQV